MGSSTAVAASGLAAAAVQLAASAHDVANALTDGFVPGRVDLRALPGGGVAAEPVAPAGDALAEVRADRAVLAPSRTDLAQEVLAQVRAAAAYRASLAALRTADDLDRALLEVRS